MTYTEMLSHFGVPPRRQRRGRRSHAHDLVGLLNEVLSHFDTPPRVHVSWVAADADPFYWDEAHDWGCCVTSNGEHFVGLSARLQSAPRYVIRYMIFHEVLHVVLPPRGRVAHHRAFRVAVRIWPDYKRAVAWLETHV